MVSKNLAKKAFLAASLSMGLVGAASIYSEAQYTPAGPAPKKLEWCQKTLSYKSCGSGNGTDCTGTGHTC